MTDPKSGTAQVTFDEVQELARQFVDLANQMKNDGRSPAAVNGGLMFASCIYATYSTAGNEGYLQESGVEKVVAVYRHNLSLLQKRKKAAQG